MKLTDAGRIVLERAKSVQESLRLIEEEVAEVAALRRGRNPDRDAAHRRRHLLRAAPGRVPPRAPGDRPRAPRGGLAPGRGAGHERRARRGRRGAAHRREGLRDHAVRQGRAAGRAPPEPPAGPPRRHRAARPPGDPVRPVPARVRAPRPHPGGLPAGRVQADGGERELALGLHRRHGGRQHRGGAAPLQPLQRARPTAGAAGPADRAGHPLERGAHLAAGPAPPPRHPGLDELGRQRWTVAKKRGAPAPHVPSPAPRIPRERG